MHKMTYLSLLHPHSSFCLGCAVQRNRAGLICLDKTISQPPVQNNLSKRHLILSKDKAQLGTCQKDSCSFSPAFVPREGTEQSGRCKRYLPSLFLRLSSATRADFRYVRILQPLPCRTNTYWEWHFRYRDMGVSFPMWGSGFIVRECLGPLCDLPIQHGASSALTLGQGDRGG